MAAALGSGENVGIVAVVGRDCTTELLAPLAASGIDISGLRHAEYLTPRAWQRFDHDGRRIHQWRVPPHPGETVYEMAVKALPEHYRSARGLHWGLHPENPTLNHAKGLMAAGMRVSLETFRPPGKSLTESELRDLMTACEIFTPGWDEAVGMVGSSDESVIVRTFRDAGSKILSLRRGELGADIWDFRDGRVEGVHVPAVPTRVIDHTGAGNAFAGALLARLDDGIDVAGAHGAAAASFMLEQFGIPSGLPDPEAYRGRVAYGQNRIERLRLF
jgi:sugar/nucleoside kinase (ribokinase family)